MSLFGAMLLERARGKRVQPIINVMGGIDGDIRTMLTLLVRLDWQHRMRALNQMSSYFWNEFIGCDLKLFHVAARSSFDHVAGFLRALAVHPGKVPRSFEKLRNWLERESRPAVFSRDLAEVVLSCGWFADLRTVRDSLVHEAGRPVLMDVGGRPFFQIYEGTAARVSFTAHTVEGDLVDLQAYTAITLGRLFQLLEQLTPPALTRYPSAKLSGGAFEFHPGYGRLSEWLPSKA